MTTPTFTPPAPPAGGGANPVTAPGLGFTSPGGTTHPPHPVTPPGKKPTSVNTPAPPVGGGLGQYLTGANRDAYDLLTNLFAGYGLGSLAPKIYDYIVNGYSADTISILLEQTPEYKQRFAGNELRTKAGLAVLSPQDYLNTEASYRQVMASAGLPASFYDSPSDFAQWIGNDVSPTEIQSRVQLATAATVNAPPEMKQALQAFYGIDESSITAYFLDQTRALPLLTKQAQAATFGAEALQRGLLADRGRMEDYVNEGLTQSTISSGFQKVAADLPNLQALAQRFGTTFSQAEDEGDVFGTNSQAAAKVKRLASQERGLFGGTSSASSGGLQQYTGQ